jgi:hypothetical protein
MLRDPDSLVNKEALQLLRNLPVEKLSEHVGEVEKLSELMQLIAIQMWVIYTFCLYIHNQDGHEDVCDEGHGDVGDEGHEDARHEEGGVQEETRGYVEGMSLYTICAHRCSFRIMSCGSPSLAAVRCSGRVSIDFPKICRPRSRRGGARRSLSLTAGGTRPPGG